MPMMNSNLANKSAAHSQDMSLIEKSVISVFEHQHLTVQDFTQPTDFEWLIAQEFAVFTIKRQRGQWQLKVGHYIGIIILPSAMTLEILPKPVNGMDNKSATDATEVRLTRHWVQRMLTDLTSGWGANNSKLPHTKNLGQLSHDLAPLSLQTPPLSQWLITQFLQLVATYHPSKYYQSQTRNQSTLQGKLLIKEQLRRNGYQPHKFACEVSTLSQDTVSNRLIKSALLLLEPLLEPWLSRLTVAEPIKAKPALAVQLSVWRQISAFSGYELRNIDTLYLSAKRQLNAQPVTRQQRQTAQQLLDFAHWLLQAQHTSVITGNSLSHQQSPALSLRLCLLINMNQAFEQWAGRQVASTFQQFNQLNQFNDEPHHYKPHYYEAVYQPRDIWLRDETGQACLSIQPDLLIYRTANASADKNSADNRADKNVTDIPSATRHCTHVIDMKWKSLSQSRHISASDAYQLTSYAQAYQAQQVWLIYPVTTSDRQPVLLRQLVLANSSESTPLPPAELWLMPFNVLTGSLNSLLAVE